MWNTRLDESQAGIKIAGRNINSLRYTDDTTLTAESKEELKSLLMKVKQESEKAGLKFSVQKTKIMACSPITSWQIDWGKCRNSVRFHFPGLQINADSDCSLEIKRRLLLGRKAMTNLASVLSRDITLLTKVCIVKAVVFPVVTYGCESWAIKKAECQSIDAFQVWCWRRLLRVPWTARRSSQSILNQPWMFIRRTDAEAPTLWSPDGKRWFIGKHLDARQDRAGGEDDRGWDGWMATLTQRTWVWTNSGR